MDYSSTDLTANGEPLNTGINGMCPVIANVSVPAGRKFSIEVCINYEVMAKYYESDLFSQGLSELGRGFFDDAIGVFSGLVNKYGSKLLETGISALSSAVTGMLLV